jgi:hypothetical protein
LGESEELLEVSDEKLDEEREDGSTTFCRASWGS